MKRIYESYHSASTLGKVARIVGITILGAIGAAAFAFLFGYIVMLLWNWLMPALFNLPVITFWYAVGIIILARLIFGGFKHGHTNHDKTPRFARRWKSHFEKKNVNGFHWSDWEYYDKFWKEEGGQAFKDYINRKKEEDKE